mmetsp:Transcript_19007/g.49018  ORF Transcript_19007/g.49018 Transcript_19007/m.49018 type:complete len:113 (+) Transcript_19007:16-354(+)
MPNITPSVEFAHVAREWRCKWSEDNEKASLEAAQQAISEFVADLKKVDGVVSVQRVVCGGCKDFKIITKLTADKFSAFEASGHGPEEKFLEKLSAVPGLSNIETQTYTLEEL